MAEPAVPLHEFQYGLAQVLLGRVDEGWDALAGRLLPPHTDAQRVARNCMALGIYRNNVMLSLVKALVAQFPVVQRLVGEQFFGALARDYVRAHPPTAASLAFYGDRLPEFITQSAHCTKLPWLADVARLELLCQQVLHARDEVVLDAGALATLDFTELERLRLQPLAAMALLTSPWPIDLIRDENLKDEPGQVDLAAVQPRLLLIYRRERTVCVLSLSAAAHALLVQLAAGVALLPAWEASAQALQLDFDEFSPLLGWLLGLGVFAGFTIDTEEA